MQTVPEGGLPQLPMQPVAGPSGAETAGAAVLDPATSHTPEEREFLADKVKACQREGLCEDMSQQVN